MGRRGRTPERPLGHCCDRPDESVLSNVEAFQQHMFSYHRLMTGEPRFYCGLCGSEFSSKQDLIDHKRDHAEATPTTATCNTCMRSFPDKAGLRRHEAESNHIYVSALKKDEATSGNGNNPRRCKHCSVLFPTVHAYNAHRRFPSTCCDSMIKAGSGMKPEQAVVGMAQGKLEQKYGTLQKSIYSDVDASVENVPSKPVSAAVSTATPSSVFLTDAGLGICCLVCKTSFESRAKFNAHTLQCSASHGELTRSQVPDNQSAEEQRPQAQRRKRPGKTAKRKECHRHQKERARYALSLLDLEELPQSLTSFAESSKPIAEDNPLAIASGSTVASTPVQGNTAPTSAGGEYACQISGCSRSYKSEAGLKTHQQDAHGIGGKGLKLNGNDSWMLSQRTRKQLKNAGLLSTRAAPARPVRRVVSLPMRGVRPGNNLTTSQQVASSRPMPPAGPAPLQVPVGQTIDEPAEIEQTKSICGSILRLLIQSDIAIQHDGKIVCGGVAFTRIGVEKQTEVVGMFDKLCHLPKKLQGEYVPHAKTFLAEDTFTYPVSDFEQSPERIPGEPGLDVVAISCSKIALAEGLEVVKIAVVDVLTCRILLNHLVCPDPKTAVKDWANKTTGLSGFHDMEAARKAGYKILKGWKAVRDALWKLGVDRQTILVGHKLRFDLDALRMMHGRAVDVAKIVEKAAGGPLSVQQLSLESLCRDYPKVHLKADPIYGQDCLQNAFGAREMALWNIKRGNDLVKRAKQKSLDYQRVLI